MRKLFIKAGVVFALIISVIGFGKTDIYADENGSSEFFAGDCNYDGKIDIKDVVLLKRYLAGYADDNFYAWLADVNGDELVEVSDYNTLMRYVAGYDEKLVGAWQVEKKNGLCSDENDEWFYYCDGQIDTDYTGLAYNDIVGWWYVENGAVNKNFTGLFYGANEGWWYVENGYINFCYTGLAYEESLGWCYVKDGTVCSDYTGLAYNDAAGWWYVENGAINTTFTGLAYGENVGWWCVENGTINFYVSGLLYDSYMGWRYVENGEVKLSHTGLVYSDVAGWWYMVDGEIDYNYKGWVSYNGAWYYIENGTINWEYTGDDFISGIDVSRYQGNIDWSKIMDSGMQFAIIKAGGRSTGDDGELYEDSKYRDNITGALANGLNVGVYFFSQAVSVEEAREEAYYALELVKDYPLAMPIAFDWESAEGFRVADADIDRDTLTKCAEEFCNIILENGYDAMIYSNRNDLYNVVDGEYLTKKYRTWLAVYFSENYYTDERWNIEEGFPSMKYDYQMWQYGVTDTVDGIDGYVDMDILFRKQWTNWTRKV